MDERDELKVALLDGAYRRLSSLASNHYNGICTALIASACDYPGLVRPFVEAAKLEITVYIQARLGRWAMYPDWLLKEAYFDIKSQEDLKRGRLAWIDAMIAALRAGEPLPERPSLPAEFVPRAADGAIVTRKFSI